MEAADEALKRLPYQTLNYRAPEVLFGMQNFGVAIDSWPLDVTLLEVAGFKFTLGLGGAQATRAWNYTQALFKQLGVPESKLFDGAPLFPETLPGHIVEMRFLLGGMCS